MGLLDSLQSMIGNNDNAKVAGGLVEELQQHPGGLGAIMDSFRQNGMDQHVNQWASGESQTATPEQVQTGLAPTGIIDRIAQRAGVSPQVVTIALSTILPLVIQHFTNEHGQPVPQSNYGGLASSILSKFL